MTTSDQVTIKGFNAADGRDEFIHSSQNFAGNIDPNQYWLHRGRSFSFSSVSSVAAGASVSALIRVSSASKPVHLQSIHVDMGGQCEYAMYENPYINVNSIGTGFVPYNMNRTSSYTNPSSFYDSPYFNASSAGTRLDWESSVESSSGNVRATSNFIGSSAIEWILAPGKDYLMRFTNKTAESHLYSGVFVFYEPDVNL